MGLNSPKLIFAADAAEDSHELLEFCEALMRKFPNVWVKFGLGWAMMHGLGELAKQRWLDPKRLFLDMKILDIDATMIAALKAALNFSATSHVGMINIHATKGHKHMKVVADAVRETSPHTHLIGVTVLTDMDEEDLWEDVTGPESAPELLDLVFKRAKNAAAAGLAGVVCSPQEVAAIKVRCGNNFLTVVPGIRPLGNAVHDQKRTGTPTQAIADGADYLVVGRPIWEAPDRFMAVAAILDEMAAARG
jgi:orotidine-5'-phosphate decarboxylase